MLSNFEVSVEIAAQPSEVWESLTDPAHMRAWMGEPEMRLEVIADWRAGSPIVMRGFHYGRFENRGVVLAFEPEQHLSYTHLSSISRLPDEPQNYVAFNFRLMPDDERTTLSLTLSNFPTETIYKHLAFYWPATLDVLKRYVERRSSTISTRS
jgi:uncharacterized protein YndB with AHSA1/START domain